MPDINPFEPDGQYGDNWVFLRISETDTFQTMTGRDKIFGLTVSIKSNSWHYNIMDFIIYQNIYDRNIIVDSDENLIDTARKMYEGHNINDDFRRSHEPSTLIHSTDYNSYASIIDSGFIKSLNKLKEENIIKNDEQPIGAELGDPEDFGGYVMLGGGVFPEIVVSSKQKGYICMDLDCPYEPGARFYFETDKLAKKGILIRDGAHLKVKDRLSIDLCDFIATKENIETDSLMMTPKLFAEFADKAYKKSVKRRA